MSRAWLPRDVPIRSRLVALPFGRVFVCDVGPGPKGDLEPPLVMLHGLFACNCAFYPLVPLLASQRRIVALDLPGCGDSDHPPPEVAQGYAVGWLAEAARQALGAVGVERCDLLGHDLGGAVAVVMAADVPDRVRRLVLVDPLVSATSLPLEGTLALASALGASLFRAAVRRSDLRRVLARGFSAPELLPETMVDIYWDRLGRQGGWEAAHAMLGQVGHLEKLGERISRVRAPTLVVWGDRDAIVSPEEGERLVERLIDARLEVLDGCGHHAPHEQPESLAALVRAHCTEDHRGGGSAD